MTDSPENPPGSARSVVAKDSRAPGNRVGPRKSTLPPPEWTAPASISSLALERWVKGHLTSRYSGPRAELAELRARLRVAVQKAQHKEEAELSKQLARALALQGAELNQAVALARRALELHEDADLRGELCGWYAGLGETALAASTLEPLCESLEGRAAARAWVRMAVLRARGGDAAGARQALQQAAERDPDDAIALELLAALCGWAQSTLSKAEASEIYLQAAGRREGKGDRAGAYEDLLRAFDVSPELAAAAQALSEALLSRGRTMAADEVLRQHGEALGSEGARVHQERFKQAVADRDWPRALGAALDAGMDVELDAALLLGVVQALIAGEPVGEVTHFDGLLAEMGLFELLSARLELSALRAPRERRGELLGYLASFRASRSLGPGSSEADEAVRIARAQLVGDDPIAAMTTLAQALPADIETGRAAGLLWAIAAEQGAASARAGALSLLARLSQGPVNSVLCSASAREYLAAGEREHALKMAAAACHAEPSAVRAVSVYAEAALGNAERVTALSIERAMALGVPRSHLCREIAIVLERIGELGQALAWTQRWLALMPGNAQAARALLLRAVAAQDAKRLSDALVWLLAQPQPRGGMIDEIAASLRTLAKIDAGLCVPAARRVLDTFGPRVPGLGETILEVAGFLGERRLVIALMERQLGAGAGDVERGEQLVELAELRREGEDPDGAARCLVRALGEGALPEHVAQVLVEPLLVKSSDGEISLAQAKADLAGADSCTPPDATAALLRAHGAALWDLAGDQQGAFEVWEHAARLDRHRGLEQFSRDLTAFAGPAVARQKLLEMAERCTDSSDRARLLVLVAGLAIDAGDRKAAFGHGRAALDIDPRRSDALAMVERSATQEDLPELHKIYARALAAQLGVYGTRALSYRGARKLERLGDHEAALGLAIKAFEAVPADGVTLVLMLRLAEQQDKLELAQQSFERVAAQHAGTPTGEVWLQKAREVASLSGGELRQRLEEALESFAQAPTGEGVRGVGAVLAEWLEKFPAELQATRARFETIANQALAALQGPSDAEIALALASISLQHFPGQELAVLAINTALGLDPAEEDFALVARHTAVLARIPQSIEVARWCVECMSDRKLAVAPELLDLALQLFTAHDEPAGYAAALRAASQRDPADVDLYRRAASAAWSANDPELVRQLDGVVLGVRGTHLVRVARSAAGRGETGVAISLLEPARRAALLDARGMQEVISELGGLYRRTGQSDRLATLLEQELATVQPGAEGYVDKVLELSSARLSGKKIEAALDVLLEASEALPQDARLFGAALDLARKVGNTTAQRELLERGTQLQAQPQVKAARLRELARLAESAAESEQAERAWQGVLELEPGAGDALSALTSLAEQREDWPSAIALLELSQAAARDADHSRELGMRRAQILENRLKRLPDAQRALEDLLGTLGEDFGVLQALAGSYERGDSRDRAAPMWERASRLAADRTLKEQLLLRACHLYAEVKDDKAARTLLSQAGPLSGNPAAAALRVTVERRSGEPLGLARALEELAAISSEPAEYRAGVLIEAAVLASTAARPDMASVLAERAQRIAPEVERARVLGQILALRPSTAGGREHAAAALRALHTMAQVVLADDELLVRALEDTRAVAERLAAAPPHPTTSVSPAPPAVAAQGDNQTLVSPVAEGHSEVPVPEVKPVVYPTLVDQWPPVSDAPPPWEEPIPSQAIDPTFGLPGDDDGQTLQSAQAPEGKRRTQRTLESPVAPEYRDQSQSADPARAPDPTWGLPSLSPAAPSPLMKTQRLVSVAPITPIQSAASVPAPPPVPEPGTHRSLVPGAPSLPPVRPTAVSFPPGASVPPAGRPAGPVPRTLLFGVKRRPSGSLEVGPAKPKGPAPQRVISVGATVRPPDSDIGDDVEMLSSTGNYELIPSQSLIPSPEQSVPLVRPSRRSLARLIAPSGPIEPPAATGEVELRGAFGRGDLEAGLQLVSLLRQQPARTRDLVLVCRQLCDAAPGDVTLLALLHDAAGRDGDHVYARAIDHAIGVLKGTPDLVAPPLVEQVEQPEEVNRLLMAPVRTPAGEVLGLIWQWAGALFHQEPAKYGVTGVERLAPNAPSALGQACNAVTRMLGMLRTPIFHKRSDGPLTITPAPINPPALVLEGDIGEVTGELVYWLGVALCATLPEQVLLATTPADKVEDILRAVGAAFGPPHSSRAGLANVAQLAGALWERIPAREQRRLSTLCLEPGALDRQAAVRGAQQAARRAGLFVSGDLLYALGALCVEEGVDVVEMGSEDFRDLCVRRPEAADLVRLAQSPEYAAARWQNPKPLRHSSRPNFQAV